MIMKQCFAFLVALAAVPFGFASEDIAPTPPAFDIRDWNYRHQDIRETKHGLGGKEFWIIEPADPSPKLAPLVIFLHGWSAVTPDTYRGWVNHLAKRGNIVVYPRYQEGIFTSAMEFFPNTLAAVRDALAVLSKRGGVKLDLNRVAIIGHSAGGVQAVNYAATANGSGLPIPKAAMIVQPGQGAKGGIKLVPMETGEKISAALKLIVMIGDADGIVGDTAGRSIWRETGHLTDRAFVEVRSDGHGNPPLKADHLSPISWSKRATDALDWLGYWRTFDDLLDAAFSGKQIDVNRDMGKWSDGTSVTPMRVER